MHPAPAFRVADAGPLLDHLRRRPFVTLSAAPQGRLFAAHAPVIVRERADGVALDFHLSRTNALTAHFDAGFPALAVSLGPGAYISPDWYGDPDQVPTWNYQAVEAQGPVSALDEADLVRLLDDLSAQEEARLAPKPPWTRAKMTSGRFEAMLRGIRGARLSVESLEGTFKLSQNKSSAARAGVAAALGAHPVAGLMRGQGLA
jgi:transcriptional regulator